MNIWSDHWSMNSFRYVSLKRNTSQKYFTLKKNPQATFNFHIFFSFLSWKKPFSVKHIIAIKLASRAELDKNLKGGIQGVHQSCHHRCGFFFRCRCCRHNWKVVIFIRNSSLQSSDTWQYLASVSKAFGPRLIIHNYLTHKKSKPIKLCIAYFQINWYRSLDFLYGSIL